MNTLNHRRTCWRVDTGVDPLVTCFEKALAQPSEVLHIMGKKGRDWMQRDFSWTEIAYKTGETYRWILYGGSKPDWVREE